MGHFSHDHPHEHDQQHAYQHAHGIAHSHGHVHENQKAVINRLAYPINDLMEGYYVLMTFTAAAAVPAELDRIFRISEDVMRSMIICKDE